MLSFIRSVCLRLHRRDKLISLEPLYLMLLWVSIHSPKPRLSIDLIPASHTVSDEIRERVLSHPLLLLQTALIHCTIAGR